MIETYKYTNGIYSVNSSLFVLNTATTRGHKYKLKRLRCCSSLRQNFSFRVVDSWNVLPPDVTNAPSSADWTPYVVVVDLA